MGGRYRVAASSFAHTGKGIGMRTSGYQVGKIRRDGRLQMGRLVAAIWVLGAIVGGISVGEEHGATPDERVEELERTVERLDEKVRSLEAQLGHRETDEVEREAPAIAREPEDAFPPDAVEDYQDEWFRRFQLGGYGELHANFGEGSDADQIDLHRIVAYVGYDFADWIKFNSEIEIEHAFVADTDSGEVGGELSIEQAYFDLLLSEPLNVRIGRVLTPLGIVNEAHEPTLFNGVERPSFSRFIIPTTWSSDGIGVFGGLNSSTRYQAYVVGGLDGSRFDAINGIRGGRIKERPSLRDPALTGRLDFYPLVAGDEHDLRLGLSGYFGGLNNANKGATPGIDGDIQIYSADFQYSVHRFDFRGVIADTRIDGAEQIGNGTAEVVFGWYLEAAYHFWPDTWRQGKLAQSDAVVFVRYDDYDTQYKMPSGVPANPAGSRREWTTGLSFYLTPKVVLKADYQIRDNDTNEGLGDRANLGLGWVF